MCTLDELIRLFGSTQALAEAVSRERVSRPITRASVYMWRSRGVPEACHAALVEACRKRGHSLSLDEVRAIGRADAERSAA